MKNYVKIFVWYAEQSGIYPHEIWMIYDTMKEIMDDDTVSYICIILCGLLFFYILSYLYYTIFN